jgi:regulator of sigma E protease
VLESIISGVIVFSVLVLVHEFGHFAAAKRVGVKVEEFAFGFPPRVFAARRGETEYAINLIPFGGYVRLLGEEDPSALGSLASKTPWQRVQVLTAGAAMNILLGCLLFALTFAIGVPVAEPVTDVTIAAIAAGSPAAAAGLRANDIVLRLDTHPIKTIADLQQFTQEKAGQETTLTVKRDGEVLPAITIVPRVDPPAGQGALGIQIANYRTVIRTYPIWEAAWMGIQRSLEVVAVTLTAPIDIARGLIPGDAARPIGVVGIAQLTGAVSSQIPTQGWVPILNLTGYLSIGIAIAQLLPLPGLDGGRLVFVLLEWVRRGKRVRPEREGMIHLAGLLLLVTLMIIITYYDIVSPVQIPGLTSP